MGTIIVTGANGSLAIPTVKLLLSNYPDFTTVLTVRNTLDSDVNTKRLREVVAQHPGAKSSIRKLDLTSLPGVHEFASTIAAEIADGKLSPLASIVCNAYHWNLVGKAERTEDAYDKTFQVTHVAHVALVLRLLGSFGPNGGRIVLFSSDAHWPGKNGLEKYPPAIPNDMDLLAKPEAHVPSDNFGRGFQRYANSKLAVVMWTYALNRYLEKVRFNTSYRTWLFEGEADRSTGPEARKHHRRRHRPWKAKRLARTTDEHPLDVVLAFHTYHQAAATPAQLHGSYNAHGI